jgi:predicted nucleotidyltransferase component of viral defense system
VAKATKDIAASLRARLLNMARASGRDFDALLLQYMQERFLYRLSISPYRPHLILKGALLFLAYEMSPLRPTKDIDFLGFSTLNELNEVRNSVVAIASIDLDDGVRFNHESVVVEPIAEGAKYKGVRAKLEVRLTAARKMLQLDIGFGDTIVPGPVEMDFPTLLDDQPSPNLLVYSRESAIAEKFEALVSLNILTSRMKDIYDILFLAEKEAFSLLTLREAIMTTFARRSTQLEDRHMLFSRDFYTNRDKEAQWKAFLQRSRLASFPTFPEAIARLIAFLEPVCSSTAMNNAIWNPADWNWKTEP